MRLIDEARQDEKAGTKDNIFDDLSFDEMANRKNINRKKDKKSLR